MQAANLPSPKPSITKKPGKRSKPRGPSAGGIELPTYGYLTLEDLDRILKKAGILTKSGNLARFYR